MAMPNSTKVLQICMVFLGLLFVSLMLILLLTGLLYAGLYVSTIGSEPPNIRFDSASFISLDNVIGPNLTAKLNVTFTIQNPNKNYDISYDLIVVTLDHGDGCEHNSLSDYNFCKGSLGSTQSQNFLQLSQTKKSLLFQINVVDQIVDNNIVADRALGTIEFGLKMLTQFSTTDASNIIEFYCKHLSFVFKSNNATYASGTCLSDPSLRYFRVYDH